MTEWEPLPDFSQRLKLLISAYGYNGNTLSVALKEIGIGCVPSHAYRLLAVPPGRQPPPSAYLLGAIMRLCPVPARYFFDEDVTDIVDDLTLKYVERERPVNLKAGPKAAADKAEVKSIQAAAKRQARAARQNRAVQQLHTNRQRAQKDA